MKKDDYMYDKRMDDLHCDIRGELYEEANRMSKAGEQVLKLNTGNPGAFGFGIAAHLRDLVGEMTECAVPYCDFHGTQKATDAIAAYHRRMGMRDFLGNDIFVTNGVSEGAMILCHALLNAGDEILLPMPCYPLWYNCTLLASGKPVFYHCDEHAGWTPDLAEMESKITNRTRAILLINPNNPTGAVYGTDVLVRVLKLAREHGLAVISDEIYDRLLFDGVKFTSTASLAEDGQLVITMNGLSKSHSLCGFRAGWMVLSGKEEYKADLRGGISKLASMRLCPNALMQAVIPAALADTEVNRLATAQLTEKLALRRKAALDALREAECLDFVPNYGAFYVYPTVKGGRITNDKKAALGLLHEKKVLLMPGSCFLDENPNRFRLVLLPEQHQLRDAVRDIDDYYKKV